MEKIYYVANARMPNEKAHGIQIAKMCEAFLTAGIALTLVVPGRTTQKGTIKEFYDLTQEVPVLKLPTPDLYRMGRLGFIVSSLFFIFFVEAFLLYKKLKGENFVVYTVDMDNFSYAFLPLAGPTFTEMHTPKDPYGLQRFFFKRIKGLVATNGLIRQRFIDDYSLADEKVIAEPNGVDFKLFASELDTKQARVQLSLPQDKKIVLYVGRFYRWKGLEILSMVCEKLPTDILCYVVGGEKEEFIEMTSVKQVPANLMFAGARPINEVPVWLQAADVLLLLGTTKNEDSNKYTSPMKLFEYMASGTPIVASATPAILDMMTLREGFLYEPDNSTSLVQAIGSALSENDRLERAKRAQVLAHQHTWGMRAERILAFINRADTLK